MNKFILFVVVILLLIHSSCFEDSHNKKALASFGGYSKGQSDGQSESISLMEQDSSWLGRSGYHDSIVEVKFIAAGDLMAHIPQIKSAYCRDSDCYDFTHSFKYIKPMIERADFAMVNFETVLAGKPFTGYPRFSAPDEIADATYKTGFDIAFSANNHAADKAAKGVERTIERLRATGLRVNGTFLNDNDRQKNNITLLEKNGIRVAFLNYTYGTNGFSVAKPFIINRIDTTTIRKDIYDARKLSPNAVCLFLHWGTEYKRYPTPEQKKIAEFCLNAGADFIIGSHPHVVQPIEIINKKRYKQKGFSDKVSGQFVAYSLGNLLSNQRWRYSDGGILLEFTIAKNVNTGNIEIRPPVWIPFWVWRNTNESSRRYYILPVDSNFDSLSLILKMTQSDKLKADQFKEDVMELMQSEK